MSTFSLHHGQFSTPLLFYTSPFLHPKSTFCLSRPLTPTSFLPFRRILPRTTRSPPVRASLSRLIYSDKPERLIGPENKDDTFSTTPNNPELEDVSRRRSWTEHGWAPWEEVLTPEAEFARRSLDEGVEVPLTSPESLEAFKMLTPSYHKKKIADMGQEEYLKSLLAFKGEIPDKLKTIWAGPLALQLVPPRDWPPKGWEVDKAELEFIREAHKLQSERVDVEGGGNWIGDPGFEDSLMELLKEAKEILDFVFDQNKELEAKFKEWVNANPDRLKMSDAQLLMKNDFFKQFKEWISLNKGENSEGEDISEVEKAVKKYEEFLKQLKEKDNANVENAKQEASDTVNSMAFERYKVFLKQYTEWVEANRDKLEEESYKFDQDYYPGRRKRGKDYKEEMLELPFIYPGQIYQGRVISISLYQGAFVDIGCVHDGWVPIKGNDWYWIRHHIRVGMPVLVEILTKRDPYRFRFPIEMRFVQPNIDHLMYQYFQEEKGRFNKYKFNKFDFPPVFHRDEDTNPLELQRESGREVIPRRPKKVRPRKEKLPLISNHPYVNELWHIHNAEQMILDHEEENPDKFKDKKFEETVDLSFDEENSVEYTQTNYEGSVLPKMVLKTNLKDLDMDSARAERQRINSLKKEAEQRGEKFQVPKLRRNLEMDKYDLLHWQRSLEEREALIRDISCRTAAGLPLEEPGKYIDDPTFWGKEFDKSNPVYRNDFGDRDKKAKRKKEKKSALLKQYRSILGWRRSKWYRMSYNGLMARKERLEAQRKKREAEELQRDGDEEKEEEVDDYDDDIDFDYGILFRPLAEDSKNKPVVNGTNPTSMDGISD